LVAAIQRTGLFLPPLNEAKYQEKYQKPNPNAEIPKSF